MDIHEYQAKAILREFGVPVPEGYAVASADEAEAAARELGPAIVVKSQVHAGRASGRVFSRPACRRRRRHPFSQIGRGGPRLCAANARSIVSDGADGAGGRARHQNIPRTCGRNPIRVFSLRLCRSSDGTRRVYGLSRQVARASKRSCAGIQTASVVSASIQRRDLCRITAARRRRRLASPAMRASRRRTFSCGFMRPLSPRTWRFSRSTRLS